jgi:hypothetical protein
MALNTVPNPIRHIDTGQYAFFGYPMPPNVVGATMQDDYASDVRRVRWRVKGDPDIHEMDFPHATEENILAVLAAMRLTC